MGAIDKLSTSALGASFIRREKRRVSTSRIMP